MSVKERIMTIRLMGKLQAHPAYAKALEITADLQNMDGFAKITFQSQEEKLAYIYNLCETGCRIL